MPQPQPPQKNKSQNQKPAPKAPNAQAKGNERDTTKQRDPRTAREVERGEIERTEQANARERANPDSDGSQVRESVEGERENVSERSGPDDPRD